MSGRNKNIKMTPFMAFMHFKRKELEKNGKTFNRGWRDVAAVVHTEWSNMDENTKKSWGTKAIKKEAQEYTDQPQFQRKHHKRKLGKKAKKDKEDETRRYWNPNTPFKTNLKQEQPAYDYNNQNNEDIGKRMRKDNESYTSTSASPSFNVTMKDEKPSISVKREAFVEEEEEDAGPSYVPNPMFCVRNDKTLSGRLQPKEETVTSGSAQEDEWAVTENEPEELYVKEEKPVEWIPQGSSYDPDVVSCFEIPDWSRKWVQRSPDYEYEFEKIRAFLDTVSDNEQFVALKYSYVHFNSYCSSMAFGNISVPAEFCCARWSIENGLEWFGGSPIDPGEGTITDWTAAFNNCEKFALPRPPYTYKPGVAYSVGEDRFEEILKSIYINSTSFRLPNVNVSQPWRYIFVSEENMRVTIGCLSWLMAYCGKNLRLCVLPAERFVGELMRTCQIRRYAIDLKAKVIREMELHVKLGVPSSSYQHTFEAETPKRSAEHQTTINGFASIPFGRSLLQGLSTISGKLQFGCIWHQRENTCGSIALCSTNLCRKWVMLSLQRAYEILDLDFSVLDQELRKGDIEPQRWSESEGMGFEARQRFGFCGSISEKRVQILEDGFVFPNLLSEIKLRMPHGMVRKPERIIWPLERDIEKDLNWSPIAPFFIADVEPKERSQRRIEREFRLGKQLGKKAMGEW